MALPPKTVSKTVRNRSGELRGWSRLTVRAITAIVSLVETLHRSIARKSTSLAGPLVGNVVDEATAAVYKGIQAIATAVGDGLDYSLSALEPALRHLDSSTVREATVAALNGLVGDYLAGSGNALAIKMRLRRGAAPLELTRDGIMAAIEAPRAKIVVLVHGLCMNDLRWERDGHEHGAALERDLSYTAVYLHYNSGLHISTNGQEFARLLDSLVAAWPVPIVELTMVTHSMGGLLARAACHYASRGDHAWRRIPGKIVFLGTPHFGVPLERGGHWLEVICDKSPYTAPLARLGKMRSAGITDLRHGCILDENWQGRDRFADEDSDFRSPVPLPEDIQCFAIAAALGSSRAPLRDRLIGDGLVPVSSALGIHRDSRLTLAFPVSHQWTAYRANHLDLLSRADVYERIRGWLEEPVAAARSAPLPAA
jgi:hypothetical protein